MTYGHHRVVIMRGFDLLGFKTDGQLINWIIVKASQRQRISIGTIVASSYSFDHKPLRYGSCRSGSCWRGWKLPRSRCHLIAAHLGADRDGCHVAKAEANASTNPVPGIIVGSSA